MKLLNKLAIAAAISAASVGAQASTMTFDFSGDVDLTFNPYGHTQEVIDDYTALFTATPEFTEFWGTIILEDYEQYAFGTHEITMGNDDVSLSIVSGMLGEIEGSRSNITTPNPDYVEGVENCRGRTAWFAGGCDFDGDGVVETEYNNNPESLRLDRTYRPDKTQSGDSYTLTMVDGQVTSFDWYAGPENEVVIGSYNERIFDRQGWLTELGEISISVEGSTTPYSPGSVYDDEDNIVFWGESFYAASTVGTASVTMVPEAETYAMMLAGLGVLGGLSRRRRNTKVAA